jgi:hypothetical protein
MGKSLLLELIKLKVELIILSVIALGGAYFLFMTKEGKRLLDSLLKGGNTEDDFNLNEHLERWRRDITKDPQAYVPGSARWKEIVKRDR